MTFLEFHELIKQVVWPEGIARNLLTQYRMDLQSALTDLQRNVKMLQNGVTDDVDFGGTFWRCGATYVSIPPLVTLLAVEIRHDVEASGDSDEAEDTEPNECCVLKAWPITQREMECKFATCADLTLPDGDPDADGFYTPDPELDTGVNPTRYFAAIIDLNLVIYPAIQSNAGVRFTYSGIKRTWEDADEFPDLWILDDQIDPEIVEYVSWKLRMIKDRCDATKYTTARKSFEEIRERMMSDMVRQEKYRLKLPAPCFPCIY